MRSKTVWALAALNGVLLMMLVGQFIKPGFVHAQAAGGRPSDYLMIPGEVVGGSSAVVYIIDMDNQQLSARTLDPNTRRLVDMPPIDLVRALGGGAGGPVGGGGIRH